jgi:tRNA(fMet)-specific endonuclease VapC
MWMLDTSICSYVLRRHPWPVKARFDAVGAGNLGLSPVVLAGLYFGAAKHPQGQRIRTDIDDFAARLVILPWDQSAAHHYGELRAHLERQGAPIGNMDLMIAAHALSLGAVLVSDNIRHFEKVPGLALENWV